MGRDRIRALCGAALLVIATGPRWLLAQETATDGLEEYIQVQFRRQALPPQPRLRAPALRAHALDPRWHAGDESGREAAWVLIQHEVAILQMTGERLERQAAAWRLRAAARNLESRCGPAADPEWAGRIELARSYLRDPAVQVVGSHAANPGALKRQVRSALARELGPSRAGGANGTIQESFRDAFLEAERSVKQAALVRRMAAEALRDFYGWSPAGAVRPPNLGTGEAARLYKQGQTIPDPVDALVKTVFGNSSNTGATPSGNPADPKPVPAAAEPPPPPSRSVIGRYAELRQQLELKPGEELQIGAMGSDGDFPQKAPEQINRRLKVNQRDAGLRGLLTDVQPVIPSSGKPGLPEYHGLDEAVKVSRDGESFLPYKRINPELGRLRENAAGATGIGQDWEGRFIRLDQVYCQPGGHIGIRRDPWSPGKKARLFTVEQQELIGVIEKDKNLMSGLKDIDWMSWIESFLASSRKEVGP